MKLRSAFILLLVLLTAACQFKVPLSEEHNIAIDTSLLGNWAMLPDAEDPSASLDKISVLRFSDSEYLLRYFSEGSEMFFRAYIIEPGGQRLLQLEHLGNAGGPVTEDSAKHRYIVARYILEGGTLTVSTLNSELVSSEIKNTESLLKAYQANMDNSELFTNSGSFVRS